MKKLLRIIAIILIVMLKITNGYAQTNISKPSSVNSTGEVKSTNISKQGQNRKKSSLTIIGTESESVIKLSGRYIGRLNNNFNPTVSEGSRTWRLDEIPENEIYLNFNFLFLEHISGLVTIAGRTTKESRTERYASKWKNLTITLAQAHIFLNTKIGSLIAYYNEDLISFHKPIKILTGLKLFQEYRHIYKEQSEQLYERVKSYENNVVLKLYNEFTDIYNPFDNIIVREVDINERFGKGTQGIVVQNRYSIFRNTFIIADDNTTREDSGSLQTYQISGTGYLVYLDMNNNSILDINENDIMHHNFWVDRLEIELFNMKFGITYIAEQLYKWEKEAILVDPWDLKYENIDNDQLLQENDLITSVSSNVFIRAAERYTRQDFFSLDFTYTGFKDMILYIEFGLNKIKQRYVSKPKKSHISRYDPSYPYFTINRAIDIEIPWNKGEHIGNAFGLRIERKISFTEIIAGYKLENKVFNMEIFDNPNEDDSHVLGNKSFFRPVSKQSIYGEINFNYSGFEPVFKFVNLVFRRIYPDGEKQNNVYKNTVEKTEIIKLIYAEIKRKFFNNFVPAIKCQYIDYGKVSKIHSQLFTPFVLRDNAESFVEVDNTKKSISLLTGLELVYYFHKSTRIKFAYYHEYISNKIEDIEDFKKIYLELIADF